MSSIIQVNNLSKSYIISHEGRESYTALRDVMANRVRKIFSSPKKTSTASKEEFWALKDISFDIFRGDRIGIIGRNGAGKSTLLKILSRITEPTSGEIKIKGRIASLLEVGTGFHPELTGRENIFLNGAILGMSRTEIKKHFDAIVEFADVEQFLDTPVKRYSSGMYVRLAFAVAAHLEPEILIVDEVLAVGDAQFQKKCLGKMEDVSKQGRTVLFVSHNMSAIQTLCNRAIVLDKGSMTCDNDVDTAIEKYLQLAAGNQKERYWDDIYSAPGNENASIKSVVIKTADFGKSFDVRSPLVFETEFWNHQDDVELNLSFHLNRLDGTSIFNIGTAAVKCRKGLYKGQFTIPGNFLNNGYYSIDLLMVKDRSMGYFDFNNCLSFEVEDYRENAAWFGTWKGAVRPTFIDFKIEKI